MLVRASDRSADYQLGHQLAARGAAGLVATEGARAAIAGVELASRLGVRVPVLQGIAGVLAGRVEPAAVASLVGDSVAESE